MHVACVATGICLGVLRHRVNATAGNASEPYSSDGGAHGDGGQRDQPILTYNGKQLRHAALAFIWRDQIKSTRLGPIQSHF